MGKNYFWKVLLGLMLTGKLFGADLAPVGTLSEGSCWYENKESLRVASFNDKEAYSGTRAQIESELGKLIGDHHNILEMNLSLHCGGYGSSLVAKLTTESYSLCVWAKFDKGKLALRSIGGIGEKRTLSNDLCDGHKPGELIIGASSEQIATELQSARWSTVIKSISLISNKIYKVVLTKEYEFREQLIIDQFEESFAGKNLIRYVEINGYHHPIGEFVKLETKGQ
jgi:hypothetical protein